MRISTRGLSAALGGLLCAASTVAQPQNARPAAVLFENVRIFDGTTDRLTAPSNVLVVGNVIKSISIAPVADPPGVAVTRIPGGGRTLMPGLVDNHVHIVFSASSQPDLLDPKMGIDVLQARATEEAKQVLLRGFTAVRDLGGPMLEAGPAIDRGELPGPRIYPSGAMISQTSGHGDFRHPHERARRFGGELSRGGLLGGGAASAYDPLDVAQYTLDEMKAAVEAADDWGTYVAVHAYTPKAVRRAVEAGVKCIDHGQLLDEETVKLLDDKGVWLSLQALDEAPPTAPASTREKKHQMVVGADNAFQWAINHGVKLAWGTAFLFSPANNKNQTADIVKLTQWMTPAQILKLVTHDNAQLLALSGPRNPYPGKLGVVEEGALADLLLVDGDPLAKLELLRDPGKTFVVIMKDGKVYKNTLQ